MSRSRAIAFNGRSEIDVALNNVQKDEIVICRLRASLVQRGFAVAVPRPDIVGEDLWFTREDHAPRLYLAQSKSMWSKDQGGRYVTNIALRWFMRALHLPNFMFVFGLGLGDQFEFVPAKCFRGQRFLVNSKKSSQVINLYIEIQDGAHFLLHNGEKGGGRFQANIGSCSHGSLDNILADCLGQSDAKTCHLSSMADAPAFVGKKGKIYSVISKCDQCGTEFISADRLKCDDA